MSNLLYLYTLLLVIEACTVTVPTEDSGSYAKAQICQSGDMSPKVWADVNYMPRSNGDTKRFVDKDDGTVFDNWCGLTWQLADTNPNGMSWAAANSHCQALELAGTGWRLPSIAELQSIWYPNPSGIGVTMSAPFDADTHWLWSGTAKSDEPNLYFHGVYVDPWTRSADVAPNNANIPVRCVR
jgi:hypothetical protein